MPTDTPSQMLVWTRRAVHLNDICAVTPFGTVYEVREDRLAQSSNERGIVAIHALRRLPDCPFPDEASARAACEADYRERMRKAGWVPADGVAEMIERMTVVKAEIAECQANAMRAIEEARTEERERIARGLELEAELLPCAEDAAVTRANANLVRADFSYDAAEALATTPVAASESPSGSDNAVPAEAIRAEIAWWRSQGSEANDAVVRALCLLSANRLTALLAEKEERS